MIYQGKKTWLMLCIIGIALMCTSAYVKYASGIAGYTGSPGESSCNFCHGGGPLPTLFGTTITSVPSFSNDQYEPGLTYTITVFLNATGYSKFGFACEVLDAQNMDAGVLQPLGNDVQTLVSNNRVNVTHTGAKNGINGAAFSYIWVAPPIGTGTISFYVSGNSVNGDHSIGGDHPLPPITMILNEGPALNTFITEKAKLNASVVLINPNPATNGNFNVTYTLFKKQNVYIELMNLEGKPIKVLLNEFQEPGLQTNKLEVKEIIGGLYLLKTTIDQLLFSSELILIN